MSGKREFGDYQTPDAFASSVCRYLEDVRGIAPSVVLEPTCGTGSFIRGCLTFSAEHIIGIDINADYCTECRSSVNDSRVEIINADFFSFNFAPIFSGRRNILVIGNPPWVTNSTLSALNSANLPQKINFKGLKGIDALTGASNFDICEYMILQMVSALRGAEATIAMLCKTSVARNVFAEMERTQVSFKTCDILEFNANKVFGINAAACLLVIELNGSCASPNFCTVYSFASPKTPTDKIVYQNGGLRSKYIQEDCNFYGTSCFRWRQGVKHDCAKVMELSATDRGFVNGLGETADIEPNYVYPLVKSSMFKSAIISDPDKYVIVTQKTVKENTAHIKLDAPRTWEYLSAHKSFFEKRKSSIYKNSPDFSMFGVGEYSYSPYKVGVSGFYKKPLFSLLCAKKSRPIMTDDTSYFICLPTFDTAYVAMLILNSECVQNYLCSIAFLDSKRPFTKKVLEQVDFTKVLDVIALTDLKQTEKQLGLTDRLNAAMLNNFRDISELRQVELPLYAS
ncbi:MAG: hypothetical protein LIO57_02990 [Oscillospiraceae bacterium]|nr:hypothetical protein [Oscillospiraceae bacterium]